MTWLVSAAEVAEQIDKTPGATRVWLHRHGIKAQGRRKTGPSSAASCPSGTCSAAGFDDARMVTPGASD